MNDHIWNKQNVLSFRVYSLGVFACVVLILCQGDLAVIDFLLCSSFWYFRELLWINRWKIVRGGLVRIGEVFMCDVEGISVGVRCEWLLRFEFFVAEKVRDELTPESSVALLIRFVGRAVGAEDSGTIGKGIESSVKVPLGFFSSCTRPSMNRS